MATDIVLKDRNGNDVTYEGIETVTFDTPAEGVQATFTHGQAVSKTVQPNFASGDMNVPIADGELVTELTIEKPENLEEENIKYGIEIAGKTGKYVPSGATKEITELDFSEGDQTVTAEEGEFWNKVLIKKPETLIPENIRYGENVGGIPGTLVHVGTDPYIEYTYNEEGKIVAAAMFGFTEIPDGCFAYSSALTSVDLSGSPGITSIGAQAFRGCSSLTEFDIPDSVTSIGTYAFYQCKALTSIDIPDSVTSIGTYIFASCTNLENVNLGKVTNISDYMFQGCSALTSIDIPDSVTSIGTYAFMNCTSLASIDIPDSVTSIAEYAFRSSGLISCIIKSGITMADCVFMSCKSLTSATIESGVTTIPSSTFNGCSALTSIDIPDSVTHISASVFSGCSALASVTIGIGVTSIGSYAFSGCNALTSATFTDTTTWYVGYSAGATTTKVTVTSPSTAATYLNTTYKTYYWTKV